MLISCHQLVGLENGSPGTADVFGGGEGSGSEEEHGGRADEEIGGGGVVLGSASECVLVALLSARSDVLRRLKAQHPFVEGSVNLI